MLETFPPEIAGLNQLPQPMSGSFVAHLHPGCGLLNGDETMAVDPSYLRALVVKTGGEFVPERRLRAKLKAQDRRTLNYLRDGLLYLDDKKPIALSWSYR